MNGEPTVEAVHDLPREEPVDADDDRHLQRRLDLRLVGEVAAADLDAGDLLDHVHRALDERVNVPRVDVTGRHARPALS